MDDVADLPPFEMIEVAPGSVGRVTVTKPFLLGRTEVTRELWDAVKGQAADGCQDPCLPGLPVNDLSWAGAVQFCNDLSDRVGLPRAYDWEGDLPTWDPTSPGYRLPTEAEWMLAAGPNTYGATDDPAEVCRYANVADRTQHASNGYLPPEDVFPCDDHFAQLAPVGSFEPDARGMYDMTGNVTEWTWDVYRRKAPSGIDPVVSTQWCHPMNASRVMRGAWHDNGRESARVDQRGWYPWYDMNGAVGIRLARNAD